MGLKFGKRCYKSCYNLLYTFCPRTALDVQMFPTFVLFQKFPMLSPCCTHLEIQQFPKTVERLKPNPSCESVGARRQVFRSHISWGRMAPEKSTFNSFETFPYLSISQAKSDHRFITSHTGLTLHSSTQ